MHGLMHDMRRQGARVTNPPPRAPERPEHSSLALTQCRPCVPRSAVPGARRGQPGHHVRAEDAEGGAGGVQAAHHRAGRRRGRRGEEAGGALLPRRVCRRLPGVPAGGSGRARVRGRQAAAMRSGRLPNGRKRCAGCNGRAMLGMVARFRPHIWRTCATYATKRTYVCAERHCSDACVRACKQSSPAPPLCVPARRCRSARSTAWCTSSPSWACCLCTTWRARRRCTATASAPTPSSLHAARRAPAASTPSTGAHGGHRMGAEVHAGRRMALGRGSWPGAG